MVAMPRLLAAPNVRLMGGPDPDGYKNKEGALQIFKFGSGPGFAGRNGLLDARWPLMCPKCRLGGRTTWVLYRLLPMRLPTCPSAGVCDVNFTDVAAGVACRQLGAGGVGQVLRGAEWQAKYASQISSVWVQKDPIVCTGESCCVPVSRGIPEDAW